MIKSVHIKNFKSIVDLQFELGSFNIIIGENGCGKSNILEAISFGAAASAEKLDYEFLSSRGIRVTNQEFIFSAFKNETGKKKIEISFATDDTLFDHYKYILSYDHSNPKKLINESKEVLGKQTADNLAEVLFNKNSKDRKKYLEEIFNGHEPYVNAYEKLVSEIKKTVAKNKGKKEDNIDFFKYIFSLFLNDRYSNRTISNYVLYSPEQSNLRKFEEATQILPIGVKGEGIFQYLKEIILSGKNKRLLDSIKSNLMLIDWYEGFDLPDRLLNNESSLNIKDKYIDDSLNYFDQKSTNEGFLYLLFYFTLFSSKDTPVFFAIDNIDTSFNPKLCMQLTKNLAALAKKNKKQVIMTTHNPAVLDGLNLKDSNQKLFVARRNIDGHTKLTPIEYKANRTKKLSEIWTSGYIGGLPENF